MSAPPSAAAADRVATIAGTGTPGNTGNGGDARKARVAENLSLGMGSDGTLYVLDRDTGGLRAITPDGHIDRVPGTEQIKAVDADAAGRAVYLVTGTELWRVSDGQAVRLLGDGALRNAASVAAAPGGTVYVAEHSSDGAGGSRIRRIDPDLTITTIAGGGTITDDPAGLPATEVMLRTPRGLTVDSQGGLRFVAINSAGDHVDAFRIQSDGSIHTLASNLGGPDLDIEGLSMGPDDRMYLLDVQSGVGGVRVVEPDGEETFAGPGVLAPEDVAVGPDGDVYVAAHGRIVQLRDTVEPTAPDRSADPWADEDAGTVVPIAEQLAEFRDGARSALENTPEDLAVSAGGTVHVVDRDRLYTALGPASVSRRWGDSPFGTDLKVHNVAPAEGGALYVRATTADEQDLVLLVHPEKSEVQVVMGGPLPPMATIERLESGGTRLYFRDAKGTLRVRGADGSLRDVAEIGDAPFAVDKKGTAYYADKGAVFRVDSTGKPRRIAGVALNPHERETGDGGPALDARIPDIRDLAVGPDGTVYLATGTGIRAITPDKLIDSIAPDQVLLVATDAHGNLYYAAEKAVRVLVRPGESTAFPWPFVLASAAALALVGAGYLIARHNRS